MGGGACSCLVCLPCPRHSRSVSMPMPALCTAPVLCQVAAMLPLSSVTRALVGYPSTSARALFSRECVFQSAPTSIRRELAVDVDIQWAAPVDVVLNFPSVSHRVQSVEWWLPGVHGLGKCTGRQECAHRVEGVCVGRGVCASVTRRIYGVLVGTFEAMSMLCYSSRWMRERVVHRRVHEH